MPALLRSSSSSPAAEATTAARVTTDASLVPSKADYVVPGRHDLLARRPGDPDRGRAQPRDRHERLPPHSGGGDPCFCRGGGRATRASAASAAKVVIPTLRERLADLRALTPPAGRNMMAAIYDRAEQIERLAADPALFNDSDTVRQALTEARRLRREYGFFNCSTCSDRDRLERLRPRADPGRSEDRQADQGAARSTRRGPIARGSRPDPCARAICGQQLSTKAARSIWVKLCSEEDTEPEARCSMPIPKSCVTRASPGPRSPTSETWPSTTGQGFRPRTPSPARR